MGGEWGRDWGYLTSRERHALRLMIGGLDGHLVSCYYPLLPIAIRHALNRLPATESQCGNTKKALLQRWRLATC